MTEVRGIQSYSVFLPSHYSADKKWPLIFGYSPMGRGTDVTKRLQAAAERYGFIVLASNVSRNGPWAVNFSAQDAMWKDAHRFFSLDDSRLYAIGHSGGARTSVAMSQRYPITGVIACGAYVTVVGDADAAKVSTVEALTPRLPKENVLLYGDLDYNSTELRAVEDLLRATKHPYYSIEFAGPHSWPPNDELERALQYLSALHGDDASAELGAAEEEKAEAYDRDQAPELAMHARREAARAFGSKKAAQALLDNADAVVVIDKATLQLDLLDIATDVVTLQSAWAEVERQLAGGPLQRRAKVVAEQAPERITLRSIVAAHRGARDEARALVTFAAPHIGQRPEALYNLACAWAQIGDKNRALAALSEAIDRGFADRGNLVVDPDLALLHNEPGFAAQVARLSLTPTLSRQREREQTRQPP